MNEQWTDETVRELLDYRSRNLSAVADAHNKEVAELLERIDYLAKIGSQLAHAAYGEMKRQVNAL